MWLAGSFRPMLAHRGPVRPDGLGDPGVAGYSADDPGRAVAVQPLSIRDEKDWPFHGLCDGPPLAGRQADPYLRSDLAPPSHRPDDSAGRIPDHGLSRRLAEPSDPYLHRVSHSE
jgi:hypothetical protein